MTTDPKDMAPTPDHAEYNAFFPSPYSLSQYIGPKSDFGGAEYPDAYSGDKWKVLMIGADERYYPMKNGKLFSTGNHPLETLLPLMHLNAAGFEIDVATVSGNPVKLEMWAMPPEDDAVHDAHQKFLPKFQNPLKLADVVETALGENSPYIAVFVPGGHAAMIGIPDSLDMKQTMNWAVAQDRHIITLCHGPACLLAAGIEEAPETYPFRDYEIVVFPDALDEGQNQDIGYMPGRLPRLAAESLQKWGIKILNEGITGQVHKDRKLLTGDSPLASNALGQLAAQTLLDEIATRG